MRRSTVFFDSFLDGFTLGGFLTKLERPGAATHLFAPDEDAEATLVSAELRMMRERIESQQAEIEGLKQTSHSMLVRLDRQAEAMRSAGMSGGKADYGSSR